MKAGCLSPDLDDLDLCSLGDASTGVFCPYPYHGRGWPRKTWWKFWEPKTTRDEFLRDEHERYMLEKQCHAWKGQEFHFCGK